MPRAFGHRVAMLVGSTLCRIGIGRRARSRVEPGFMVIARRVLVEDGPGRGDFSDGPDDLEWVPVRTFPRRSPPSFAVEAPSTTRTMRAGFAWSEPTPQMGFDDALPVLHGERSIRQLGLDHGD